MRDSKENRVFYLLVDNLLGNSAPPFPPILSLSFAPPNFLDPINHSPRKLTLYYFVPASLTSPLTITLIILAFYNTAID